LGLVKIGQDISTLKKIAIEEQGLPGEGRVKGIGGKKRKKSWGGGGVRKYNPSLKEWRWKGATCFDQVTGLDLLPRASVEKEGGK